MRPIPYIKTKIYNNSLKDKNNININFEPEYLNLKNIILFNELHLKDFLIDEYKNKIIEYIDIEINYASVEDIDINYLKSEINKFLLINKNYVLFIIGIKNNIVNIEEYKDLFNNEFKIYHAKNKFYKDGAYYFVSNKIIK